MAVIAALAGTATALPGANTVDSGDIKAGQVKRPDLANNAVNGAKVAVGSLTAADLAAGSVGASEIADGSVGAAEIATGTWTNITFNAGWQNYGAGFANVQCYRDPLGFVHLRGVAKRASAQPSPETIGTFPAACRPAPTYTMIPTEEIDASATGVAPAFAYIESDGDVRLDSAAPILGRGISLDGVTFTVSP